jgi:inhibitor of cysteine peptidase
MASKWVTERESRRVRGGGRKAPADERGVLMQKVLRLFTVVVLVATVALSAGCASSGADAKQGTGTGGVVKVSGKDSGSTISIRSGQKLVITLDSNATTGYRWALDGDLPAQLAQIGESAYKAEKHNDGRVGAGGTETWTFEGKSKGEGTIKLKYWRSFEPTAAPASTFEIKVRVL